MKQRYTLYGNCQVEQLAHFLNSSSSFANQYEYVPTPGMYRMGEEEFAYFLQQLPDLDLLIYQHLSPARGKFSTDQVFPYLSSAAQTIAIPSLFFTGYNPEVAYVRLTDQRSLFYHDRNLYQHLQNNTFSLYQKQLKSLDFFPKEFSLACLSLTLNELKAREQAQKVDVVISDFIEQNFQKHRLFHVLNHPSRVLLQALADRILQKLGQPEMSNYTGAIGPLERHQFPIYLSHAFNLGLQFENSLQWVFQGKVYSLDDYGLKMQEQYATLNPDLIEHNANRFRFTTPKVQSWELAIELLL